MSQNEADKDKPTIINSQPRQVKENPLVAIGKVINNHALSINEIKNAFGLSQIDIKANKATAEIFDKRFTLFERQLDNLDKELSRLRKQINEE
ncbi:hypothetical protein LCGC14_0223780 [marine sediment metagenome]|uniref:Uncharacterized protein n=1 Tax=marine sediment metagenome TaxID=412755 RepID=A0A0F9UCA6_9ZZZZ